MKLKLTSVAMVLAAATFLALPGELAAGASPDLGRAALDMKRLEKRWGIEVASVRLSANGKMVDFRYKVTDPDKATELGDREAKPLLIDQASGSTLLVPKTPKIGPLRQTAQKPEPGKVYFMLFANPGNVVKAGSKVAVAIGDFRAENLTVE